MKRKMQALGREELASPVAEAIRKMSKVIRRECSNCEHYWEDRNWCNSNNTSTTAEDCCDDFKQY